MPKYQTVEKQLSQQAEIFINRTQGDYLRREKKRRKVQAQELRARKWPSEVWFKDLLEREGLTVGQDRRERTDILWNFPVGSYILDFIPRTVRMGIEIDGSSHGVDSTRDQVRDATLNQKGWQIIRIRSYDINNAKKIIKIIKKISELRVHRGVWKNTYKNDAEFIKVIENTPENQIDKLRETLKANNKKAINTPEKIKLREARRARRKAKKIKKIKAKHYLQKRAEELKGRIVSRPAHVG